MYEVYTRERPARPAVGAVTSAGLLIGVVVLAAVFTSQRREIDLTEPLDVPGWSIRFSVPAGWTSELAEPGGEPVATVLTEPGDDGAPTRRLTIARWSGLDTADPGTIALFVFQQAFMGGRVYFGSFVPPVAMAPLGPVPGARITLDGSQLARRRAVQIPSMIVHVGVVSANDAYSIRLDVAGPLRSADEALMDAIAASVHKLPLR